MQLRVHEVRGWRFPLERRARDRHVTERPAARKEVGHASPLRHPGRPCHGGVETIGTCSKSKEASESRGVKWIPRGTWGEVDPTRKELGDFSGGDQVRGRRFPTFSLSVKGICGRRVARQEGGT
jgi:hypothetical protein